MYSVYVLISEACKRTYVGQTNDLTGRKSMHNEGKVKSTSRCRPWRLLYHEEFETRAEAMRREKWFKSRTGRAKIKELVEAEKKSLS